MRKLSILLCWLLLALSPSAWAQTGAKAYAPEDLQKLDVNGRIRVLNKEYSDLSDGQRLPNDQLEFYLDQIEEANWGFSEIRQDMQESLGARPDSRLPPPRPGPQPIPVPVVPPGGGYIDAVECASANGRYSECPTPFRRPVLETQLSRGACIEGETWGRNQGIVWVNRGCRGRFVEGRRGPPGPGPRPDPVGDSFTCASEDGRRTTCRTPWGGPARLRRQLSSSACIEGQTWGTSPGVVWVNRGCRGIFEEVDFVPGYPGSAGQVVCESLNGGLRICGWNDRLGRPRLLREFSRGACIEGRSWGVDRRGLWVDRGCSGVFGVR